ncbi:MAG: electron transport complex subunit RsxC [Ignavibacteriae bacterium HGW-Ignavibacteriae-2]|jgi:electron transport complex protein RnfC|nr:MAG: electron transport complex subunit RsxC [Ignavibacteriae bacterium HGW-Ignavibacteriae-2]
MGLLSKVKSFKGGVHPAEWKELTKNLSFEQMPNPNLVIIPLAQHIGKPANPIVKKKDEVKAGQIIAEAEGFISSPIHSPVSGIIKDIHRENTVSGFPKDSIVIQSSESNEVDLMDILNPETITPEEIRQRVKAAGIVGQGGAAFPTFVKLSPPEKTKIDCVILNGCECEPYLTRDDRYMIERTQDVVNGLKLIMKALGVKKGAIGIENNKSEAISKIRAAVKNQNDISVEILQTKYPQGAEKMLIKAVLDREVPPGKLPMDVGAVIQNIGTAIAIYDSVTKGEAQITAAITVSGGGIKQPKNVIVPVGTPLKDVLDFCGGVKDNAVKVIVGGPMMGVTQFDFGAPVMKATSGILVLTSAEVNAHPETPCLKCGKCIEVCPLGLVPTKLARFSQLERYEDAENFGITTCMECGTCTFTCPANIPLVQWLRLGKQKVLTLQREKKSA